VAAAALPVPTHAFRAWEYRATTGSRLLINRALLVVNSLKLAGWLALLVMALAYWHGAR